ncbi:hypothetical protein DPMN_043899 [Dreissena polymorpha]|uniref:Ig-like domain-containing protein n=2 Tax=Dreissena polymorpha TaxID=45954 RepID=A0A9D4D3M2_DREPO|nr:hypothetical protein DPMN_043899 [Dreissena polymorpha]
MAGFHKVGIYINFNDPVQSLWRAAKGSVEMTLQAIDEEKTNMKKRDIRNTALNGMYKAMRMPRDAEMHDGDLDMLVNFTFQYIEDNAFDNHTDGNMDEYTYWKQIYAEKCLQFTRCHTFLLDTTVILSQLVNDTAATIRNISSIQDNMQSFNIESISNNLSFASIGIDPTVAQDEFNISMATLEDTIEGARGNLSYDPLLTNIVAFADESRKFLEDKVGSVNNIMSLNLWIAAMNDVTKEYFHNDTCVSFLDCAHYAVAVLYQQFVAVNVINQSESTDTISEFEDTFLLLVGNNSHTIQDLDSMATSLILTLQRMREHDVFCSKPPEMVEPLRNQTAKSGTDISLICNATGDPDPDFWWYKDGKLMPNHHKMILTMSNASEEDAATYYCVAGNLVANYSFEEVHVFVQKEILHDNGFYKKDDGPNLPLERILAPILGIATCAIVIGLVVWKFRKRTVVSKGSSASNTQAVCEE